MKNTRLCGIGVLVVCTMWLGEPVIGGQENAAPRESVSDKTAALDQKIQGPLEVSNIDLSQLLALLQSETGLQLVMGEGIDAKVTFSLQSPSVRDVLDTVLPVHGLGYLVKESGIVVVDRANRLPGMEEETESDSVIDDSFLDKQIKGPLEVSNIDVQQLMGLIQSETGVQLILGEGIQKKLTFSLSSPTLRDLFDTVLPANGLKYAVKKNNVVVVETVTLSAASVEVLQRILEVFPKETRIETMGNSAERVQLVGTGLSASVFMDVLKTMKELGRTGIGDWNFAAYGRFEESEDSEEIRFHITLKPMGSYPQAASSERRQTSAAETVR